MHFSNTSTDFTIFAEGIRRSEEYRPPNSKKYPPKRDHEAEIKRDKSKDLVDAVRKKHPAASKKEISRAAFYAVILAAEEEPGRAEELHELASVTRNDLDE